VSDGTPKAADVLERLRAEQFPDVPADLVKKAYELEHARQFELERGPVRAELRDLIEEAAGEA
jgi:hypothetical protein